MINTHVKIATRSRVIRNIASWNYSIFSQCFQLVLIFSRKTSENFGKLRKTLYFSVACVIRKYKHSELIKAFYTDLRNCHMLRYCRSCFAQTDKKTTLLKMPCIHALSRSVYLTDSCQSHIVWMHVVAARSWQQYRARLRVVTRLSSNACWCEKFSLLYDVRDELSCWKIAWSVMKGECKHEYTRDGEIQWMSYTSYTNVKLAIHEGCALDISSMNCGSNNVPVTLREKC